MSFSFGPPTTTASGSTPSGFSLGAPAPTFGSAASTSAAPMFGAPAGTGSVFAFGTAGAPATTTAAAMPTFGSIAGDASGFRSFAAPAPTAPSTGGSTLFGASAAPGGTGSFAFGSPVPTLGANPPAFGAATKPTTLSFGTPATGATAPPAFGAPTSSGLTFGAPGASASTANVMTMLGNASAAANKQVTFTQPTAPLNLSAPATTSAQPSSTFSLGSNAAAPSNVGFNLGSSLTSGGGFTLGTPAAGQATTQPSLSLPKPASTTVSTGFSLAAPTTTAPPAFGAAGTGLSFTSKPASTVAGATTTTNTTAPILGGLAFGTPSSTTTGTVSAATTTTSSLGQPSLLTGAPSTSITAVSTSTPGEAQQSQKPMTYSQLEEFINKWTVELEAQEKIFLTQATQVNAWDRVLLENGDKIAALSTSMDQLQLEQQKLDLELDYITSQERELEELIEPLEKAVSDVTGADTDRQHTYELAVGLESTTKQMAEDLKEVIDHLNELNHAQDENNPIVQISRILNAHMNSLQWIDQTVTSTQQQLDETTKMIEIMKKDSDASFNLGDYYV